VDERSALVEIELIGGIAIAPAGVCLRRDPRRDALFTILGEGRSANARRAMAKVDGLFTCLISF